LEETPKDSLDTPNYRGVEEDHVNTRESIEGIAVA
jgi:hypothetical protein